MQDKLDEEELADAIPNHFQSRLFSGIKSRRYVLSGKDSKCQSSPVKIKFTNKSSYIVHFRDAEDVF